MTKIIVSLTLVLATTWLLFSGMWTDPLILALGALSVGLSVWMSLRLGVADREGHPIHLLLPALRYLPWLVLQVVKANIHVARRVLGPRTALRPRIVRYHHQQVSDLGRTTLANSVTLTPGTVTLHVRKHELWVYALDEECAQGVLNGEMDRRVRRIEEPGA